MEARRRKIAWSTVVFGTVLASLVTARSASHGDDPRTASRASQDASPVRSFEAGRFFGDVADRSHRATPVESLRLPAGFRAELLYTVPLEEQGSWVCLASDPKGRLITSAQSGKLYRITPPRIGGPASKTRVEPIDLEIGSAQGLLCAFDSMYVVANSARSGLYRVRDTDGDDRFDQVQPLRRFDGEGEHGPHAVVLGPGGKQLYIVGGNGSYLATPPELSAIPAAWREDRLQRRIGASDGAFGPDRPGGWIFRTDPDGKSFELVAMGFRNPYDLAFNPEGELFTFDSDMEWDAGTPWYRPTRVNHVIDGADFGWRAGTSKWPEDYLDSFGSVVDVGFSSPTGVAFGTGSRFPSQYQRALFIADWSYGNIFVVHLEPRGASYTGTIERFVSGAPLPVTDLIIGPQDGALYFTVGGRGTTSALYRVTYSGKESTAPVILGPDRGAESRQLRHRLEAGAPLDLAWSNLSHADRAIRYAARQAVERQPVEGWRGRALAEPNARARIAALAALARRGDRSAQAAIIEALGCLDWAALADEDRLDLLRAYELAATRLGPPDPGTRERILQQLSLRFPSDNDRLDRELAEILTALEAPGIIPRTLRLLDEARTQEQQIHFVMCLRDVKHGWTLDQRKRLLSWFAQASAHRGGVDFGDYLDQIRRNLVKQFDPHQETALADLLRERPPEDPYAGLKKRSLVRRWTVAELLPPVERANGKGNRGHGREVFATALCYRCHRFEGQGGMIGPDLTGVARRFNARDLLEAAIEPNRVISDQYRISQIALKDGRVLSGKVKDISGNTLVLMKDPLNPADLLMVARDGIDEITWSGSSMMPEGLLDTFTKEEIIDLMAFLHSPTGKEERGKQNTLRGHE
jgi:putative heme-binding domain-containing protein